MQFLVKQKRDGRYFKSPGQGVTDFRDKAYVYTQIPVYAESMSRPGTLCKSLVLVYVGNGDG